MVPRVEGCQSQGDTLEEAVANIKEAIGLYLETLSPSERNVLLSREILTTAVEVNLSCGGGRLPMLERALLAAGFELLRSKGSHRMYGKRHDGAALHPKITKQALEIIGKAAQSSASGG